MTGTLLPGPGVEIEVALGVGLGDLAGRWDDARWDANVWAQPDTSLGDWLDVTCDTLNPFTLGAGSTEADGAVTRWEAATAALTLYGAQYDPRSGPWAGLLGPNIPVRVRWRPPGDAWLTAFNGFTDDTGFTYEPKTRLAQLSCTDPARIFAAYDGVEQTAQGQGETAAQRVVRIANLVGWPLERRDITPGGVPVRDTTLAQPAWTQLLQVADTDLALLWFTRAGDLAYRPQGKVIPRHYLDAVIGCHPDPADPRLTITPVDITGQQPTVTRNVVSVSRQSQVEGQDAATVTVRDETSITRFLTHSYQRTDLIHTQDTWTSTVAQAILMSSAWPSTAPEQVELHSRVDPAAAGLLLALEPSLTLDVQDGLSEWQCEPAGWSVEVGRREIAGTVNLLDVTLWYGSSWDQAVYDRDRWSF